MAAVITLTTRVDLSCAEKTLNQAYKNTKYPIGPTWALKDLTSYNQKNQLIGVELDSQPIGFICILPIDAHTVEILMLALDSNYWGLGIMKKALLQFLHKYNEVWLEVHAENKPAIGLYLSIGFEQTGVRAHYYNDGDALVMRYKKS